MAMFDFVSSATSSSEERWQPKIQNENISIQRESNQWPLAFQACALNHWTNLVFNELYFKHYLEI